MSSSPIVCFTGVYNADAGLAGEAKYVFEKMTGKASCALCDITHGLSVRGKTAWRECATTFPVPIRTFHRNDQPPVVAAVTDGLLPCVVAQFADGSAAVAVTSEQLLACKNDVAALESLLTGYLDDHARTA